MTKLVTFLGRKPVSATGKPSTAPRRPLRRPPRPAAEKPDIELDHELFSPIATQLGQENEAVRNLLLDAEHKIGELEIIKRSIGSLVDPVSKTLRAYEEAKSEKLSLQGTLNTTRAGLQQAARRTRRRREKGARLRSRIVRLRDVVAVAQQSVAALERTKAEQLAELTARRTHIAELQRHAQQQGSDLELAREENRRLGERIATADKRMVQLEGQAQAAQQKAMQADQERAAVQASLDKALAELAQIARRLSETDKTLAATQNRLKVVEASLAETQAERTRLSTVARRGQPQAPRRDERAEFPLRGAAGPLQPDREPARRGAPDADGARRRDPHLRAPRDRSLHRARRRPARSSTRSRRRSPSASCRSRISRQAHAALDRTEPDARPCGEPRGKAPAMTRRTRSRSRATSCKLLEKQLKAARDGHRDADPAAQRAASARAARALDGRRRAGSPAARTSPA